MEDSALLRKLLEDTLNAAGFQEITFFENGREALAYLTKTIEDGHSVEEVAQLMITDIEMPQMDGHHLTKVVKDNPNLATLPIVIFSSLITDDLRHKGQVVGANAQVSKPEINELIHIIDNIIL